MNPQILKFDLKAALRQWKKDLASSPGLEDGYIAELEAGLLDEIAALVRSGMGEEEAFSKVTAEMGPPEDIGSEFFKAHSRRPSSRPPWKLPRFVPGLLWNCLKVALRKIRRHKGYSLINIAGLAVGLAACILILLWVRDELSYDRYHENANRIYRVAHNDEIGGASFSLAPTPFAAGPAFIADIPEIEACARILGANPLVIAGDRKFDLTGVYYSETAFFRIFTCRFLNGDPRTALSDPGSIVLTEDTARKLFGRTDVLGASLNFNHTTDYRVTGVIRNVPMNSHFRWNALASLNTIAEGKEYQNLMNSWFDIVGWVYLRLKESADQSRVEKKIAAVVEKHAGADARAAGMKMTFWLQKLADIHLKSHLQREIGSNGDIRFVYAFSLIAVFILALAGINFTNLATARSAGRSKEVGLRKVMGADRNYLILQFLGESVLMAGLASAGAIAIVATVLPAFNQLAGKSLTAGSLFEGGGGLGILGLTLLSGLLAGIYPALFLSSFRPSSVLEGAWSRGLKRSSLRSVLVVFQFSVSVLLAAATLILLAQLSYMKNTDLGFDKNHILVVRVKDPAVRQNAEAIAVELERNPAILEASLTNGLPGKVIQSRVINLEGRPETESHGTDVILSDYGFIRTYGIRIVKGRDFSRAFGSDKAGVFLINETAARRFGWGDSAIGRKIGFSPDDLGEVVGIMKDFHYRSLRDRIGPLVVRLDPFELASMGSYLSLKIRGGDIPATVDFVKSQWTGRSEREFEYFFADENFNTQYRIEESAGRLLSGFAAMAVFVACLGLFGLASYAAEQRTKEIGVRKVLGATEAGLAGLLAVEFVKLVILANVLALPMAYFLMEKLLLPNFAYRTPPRAWVFVLTAVGSLLIALLTVSFQAGKAALADPVKSLRYE
jgi:putative ABC transport system permease protein